MEWLIALCVFLFILLCGAVFAAYRFYRRAVIYDEVFQYLADDIAVNVRQFQRMENSRLTTNDPEIVAAHRNMMLMAKRLNEILIRMEEASGLRLRPPAPPRPPVVV